MASRLNNDQSTQGPSGPTGPTDLTNTHLIDLTHTDPSHEDLTCTTPDSEATDAENWQATIGSSTLQPPFRAFRINTPQELELLTALEIHRSFTAEYGNKEAAWERAYQYLKTQDEKRESKLYETLKPRTCKRRWKTMRKMCEESKKYLSRASGTSPLPSREMDKIQSQCDEEEVGKTQTEQARLNRKTKKDQTQQSHVNVAPSLFHVEESTFLPSEISTSSHAESSTPTSMGSHHLTPSTALSPVPLSVGPDITMGTNLIDLESLIDRSDQDSAMIREQRMALYDMKGIFVRDIGERKKRKRKNDDEAGQVVGESPTKRAYSGNQDTSMTWKRLRGSVPSSMLQPTMENMNAKAYHIDGYPMILTADTLEYFKSILPEDKKIMEISNEANVETVVQLSGLQSWKYRVH